ncbi:DEAD/DEAH box helicase family protein [Paenibacillus ginsengihumi]|uniref:DEAD/DEAH box helicase family protein n=1 Tax=Paenibacillus ginsengihumi TaxID=431596 RepID=UPI0003758554|nr:DEAD/DEAH box helicase family protein [Paenibacillus ginsengihumi]
MNRSVQTIAARMSLRDPQRESLRILADAVELLNLGPGQEDTLQERLRRLQAAYPDVTDFEREFPSLCFALATGVGKTRLMGAFIAYLHEAKGMKNFFVLAPNLTIYRKLIRDFTPHTPKYVFQGVGAFAAQPPVIITGDNYEEGAGVRSASLFGETEVHINIFNIAKINAEVRGGKMPRIKRLSEYIGQSYFDYLAALPDLVLLMDESHRYRASAGVKALNELNPVFGLELTATPQTETGTKSVPFRNVIYSYPLYRALEDGFVKEPAVATRENFDPSQYTEEELERLKLEDGLLVHEDTKAQLQVYAAERGLDPVRPFVLIVAQDTAHAESLMRHIESDAFFGGKYRGRVITVHSSLRGEEKDETVEQLMRLEQPTPGSDPPEIVIHVNMLKEGWDVTNLYTIIPLRAANSKTLVEQSIGRGLRLPYGRRTGVKAVDRLTIIAHDKFQEIVDAANDPRSVLRRGVLIGKDVAETLKQAYAVPPLARQLAEQSLARRLAGAAVEGAGSAADRSPEAAAAEGAGAEARQPEAAAAEGAGAEARQPDAAASGGASAQVRQPDAAMAARLVEAVEREAARFESLPGAKQLLRDDVIAQLADRAAAACFGPAASPSERERARLAAAAYAEGAAGCTIDIPRIRLVPVGDVAWGYRDFDLDGSRLQAEPVSEAIRIRHLVTHRRDTIAASGAPAGSGSAAARPEDVLVKALAEYPDIDYAAQARQLYRWAGQAVAALRSRLPDEAALAAAVLHSRSSLAGQIYEQMKEHYYEESAGGFEAVVTKGFETLKPIYFTAAAEGGVRPFREAVADKQKIRSMAFTGFRRCLYPLQKFDSDSERRFAVLCEDDADVLRWFKPASGQFAIRYGRDASYHPDFIVETRTGKLICEIKRSDQVDDGNVRAKARAVAEWCRHASLYERSVGGKEWRYALIPHDEVKDNATLEALARKFAVAD